MYVGKNRGLTRSIGNSLYLSRETRGNMRLLARVLAYQCFLCDFCIKYTGAIILHKAYFVMNGDITVSYRDFDLENHYAPVARNEAIWRFLAKSVAQNSILVTADISNAYLYGDVDRVI